MRCTIFFSNRICDDLLTGSNILLLRSVLCVLLPRVVQHGLDHDRICYQRRFTSYTKSRTVYHSMLLFTSLLCSLDLVKAISIADS